MERESDGTLITLLDEDGVEQQFEHLATLEHDGSSYVALVPAFLEPEEFVESEAELVILKMVIDENEEEILATIEDDDEFEAVSSEFEKLLEAEYEIQGEDDVNEDFNDADDEDDEDEDEDDDQAVE